MQKFMRIIICSILLTLIAGCHSLAIYKRDQIQGNLITSKMLTQLQVGMTRAQVLYIMGSPLLADPFNQNQWDYVYQQRAANGQVETKRATLIFKDNQIEQINLSGDLNVQPINIANPATTTEKTIKPHKL